MNLDPRPRQFDLSDNETSNAKKSFMVDCWWLSRRTEYQWRVAETWPPTDWYVCLIQRQIEETLICRAFCNALWVHGIGGISCPFPNDPDSPLTTRTAGKFKAGLWKSPHSRCMNYAAAMHTCHGAHDTVGCSKLTPLQNIQKVRKSPSGRNGVWQLMRT